ncbi:uncharacterized protein BN472_00383 [Tannerella sp. CAG:118]|nr:uncharacterized protein BN472_00383 [Tannerella sp. CAG:118]
MVTSIYIPIMLHRSCMTTCPAKDTNTRSLTYHPSESSIKHLDIVLSNILYNPLVKNITIKLPKIFGLYTPRGHFCIFDLIGRQKFQPVISVTPALYDRRKLHIMTSYLLKETICFYRVMHIIVINYRQGIKLHIMFLQQFYSSHYSRERPSSTFIFTITVMYVFRAINGYTDQKIIVFEKTTPFIIQQYTVGLNRICDKTTSCILFLI